MIYYNRDRNISGLATLTGLTFEPSYGSSATFEAANSFYTYSDKFANIQPNGLNVLIGRFNFDFSLRESDAQKFVDFYESQSGTGIFAINDNSNIYRTLSGTIDNLNLQTENNDKYAINIAFNVERNASALKWSGQSFLNHEFTNWSAGQTFLQDDVVYFEHDFEEPSNNFFYCTSGHSSSLVNHPLSTGNLWTNGLFSSPNDSFSVNQAPVVAKNEFLGSFADRIKDQNNSHLLEKLELSYKNISDKRLKSLLHFLESRLGYKKFSYQIPEIYNRPKTFFSPTWTHEWNYKDSNNLKISVLEDPFGMIPSGKPNIYAVQTSGQSSFVFSLTGQGNLFYDSGDGKKLISQKTTALTWANTGINHAVKIYGKVAGFTGLRQGIERLQLFSPAENFHLNVSGNSISTLNLYEASIGRINCANNSIGGLDFNGQSGLVWADISNNNSSYLNIAGCTRLTGLYAVGNSFPQTHVDGSLKVLDEAGNYSGVVNFSGSSGVSRDSLGYISSLSGKSWSVGYEHSPVSIVPIVPETGSQLSPAASYLFSVAINSDHQSACLLTPNIDCLCNSAVFDTTTRINFSESQAIESYAIGDYFYVQSSSQTLYMQKICCDIAAFVDGPFNCADPSVSPSDLSQSLVNSASAICPSYSPTPDSPSNTLTPSP